LSNHHQEVVVCCIIRVVTKTTFHFIDESGDPGHYSRGKKGSTWYYILGDLVVSPDQIRGLRQKLGSVRYLFDYDAELKSHKASPRLQEKLLGILQESGCRLFIKFVDKRKREVGNQQQFLEEVYLSLLRKACKGEANEIVIDQTDKILAINLRGYLLEKLRRKVNYVTLVNSEYVDMLQISDLVTGAFKDFLVDKKRKRWGLIKDRAVICK